MNSIDKKTFAADAWQPRVTRDYPVRISKTMNDLINHSAAIARQFLPSEDELTVAPEELRDPIGDEAHSPVDFLVHRYRNRVLWKVTQVCAVHCRFCFRRELIGQKGSRPDETVIQQAHDYMRQHHEIEEVILSGGDPMTLSAERLRLYVAPLLEIEHIRRIRVHTRMPIVAPEQIKEEWLTTLQKTGKQIVYVLHVNHADEFNPASDALLAHLATDHLLLSQTVLLRGVNDDAAVLAQLMEAFLARRIKPYYLHHLDLARGTGHFRVTIDEGRAIYQQLRQYVSGIALPTYIVEIPGGDGKIAVMTLTAAEKAALHAAGIK